MIEELEESCFLLRRHEESPRPTFAAHVFSMAFYSLMDDSNESPPSRSGCRVAIVASHRDLYST